MVVNDKESLREGEMIKVKNKSKAVDLWTRLVFVASQVTGPRIYHL